VLEYTYLPSEAPDVIPNHRPGISWPSKGSVSFVDYSTRYRPELGLVLQNLNLNFKPGEKIGVVGRTGAGKSSLALALFRIIEPLNGGIHIDDVDISTIGVLDLRQRLTVIPQDPALFEGTVRENLDPGEEHDDTELWAALGMSRLLPFTEVTR
jgi:ATP-binding cassette subfamily C (CFTR/MRP) protein 1